MMPKKIRRKEWKHDFLDIYRWWYKVSYAGKPVQSVRVATANKRSDEYEDCNCTRCLMGATIAATHNVQWE